MLWYNYMCLLIWTVFSGERCGPWASCFITTIDLIRTLTSTTSELQGPLSLLASFYMLNFYHRRSLDIGEGHFHPKKKIIISFACIILFIFWHVYIEIHNIRSQKATIKESVSPFYSFKCTNIYCSYVWARWRHWVWRDVYRMGF